MQINTSVHCSSPWSGDTTELEVFQMGSTGKSDWFTDSSLFSSSIFFCCFFMRHVHEINTVGEEKSPYSDIWVFKNVALSVSCCNLLKASEFKRVTVESRFNHFTNLTCDSALRCERDTMYFFPCIFSLSFHTQMSLFTWSHAASRPFLSFTPLHTTPASLSVAGWSFSMGSAYQFHSWRVFVVVCALPCVSAVVALTFMPESPRFFLEVRDTCTHL